MKIINPLYDKAFKYLMENNKFAKKVLSLILDVNITEVYLEQQETFVPDERRPLQLFRMDFKATVKEADGSTHTVLIEVQKSKYSTDIGRFRNYLGSNYMVAIDDLDPIQEPLPTPYKGLPIITVYILGYNLPDLPYMAVTVNREVINSVSKERLNVKSLFIEHLTHQSHIIQVRRLPEKRRTKLEKFLTLFNQDWCTKQKFILDLQEIPPGFSEMARYLQSPLMDDAFRRNLRAEQEINFIFDEQAARHRSEIALVIKEKQEAEKQKLDAVKQLQELEKQKQEAEKQKQETEQMLSEEQTHRDILARKLAEMLKKNGASPDIIFRETGLKI